MSINKIEIQDGSGNVYYPKTSIDSVIYSNSTSIEEKIRILEYRLNELKGQLANSINNKTGSSLTSNSTVDEMAAIINSIKTLEQATADANATASNILVDKTAYVNGTKITGTMPEKGAFAQTLSANGTINLGSGHYDSIKITQSLNTRGATVWKPSTSVQSIPSGTYLTGTQTIQGDTNLAPQNIRAGVSIFGVGGALTVQSLGGKNFASGKIDFSNLSRKTSNPYSDRIFTFFAVKISIPFTPKCVYGILRKKGTIGVNRGKVFDVPFAKFLNGTNYRYLFFKEDDVFQVQSYSAEDIINFYTGLQFAQNEYIVGVEEDSVPEDINSFKNQYLADEDMYWYAWE